MSAPKSDTATIAARRNRLLELLSEGRTEVQAADILRDEGYPASPLTIRRDVQTLAPRWRDANLEAYSEHAQRQFNELLELKAALVDPSISKDRRISLALQILDREFDLLGTKAPTKSVHADVSGEFSPQYLKFKKATSGLSEVQLETVYKFAESVKRVYVAPVIDAGWFPAAEPRKLTAAELADPVDEEHAQ
jgi:hypothetical protein